MRLIIVSLLLFAFQSAHAKDKNDLLVRCLPTPTFSIDKGDYNTPEEEYYGNNLRRITGEAYVAEGKPITVRGRLVDQRCVPISDAIIELWQTNADGIYQHNKKSGSFIDKHFSGYGKTATNNLGEFSFITIYPGHYGNSAPHLHFKITHQDLGTTYTRMYFEGNSRNNEDKYLNNLSEVNRKLVTGLPLTKEEVEIKERIYLFDITLKGKNKHRRF